MLRNQKGQFIGCGNPKGRPRRAAREISAQQNRDDFFAASEMLVPIIENNKRKLIPASVAINKQLIVKAASGNLPAILAYKKMQSTMTRELWDEKTALLEQYLKSAKTAREFPEDITDDVLEALQQVRAVLAADFPV